MNREEYFLKREFEVDDAIENSVQFIKEVFDDLGFTKAVIGVSGGIDSATVLALTVRALGRENVIALSLPYESISTNASKSDAQNLCSHFGVKMFTQSINGMVDGYFNTYLRVHDNRDDIYVRKGNVCARSRMIALMDWSKVVNGLVSENSNLSEYWLGYYTVGGDNIGSYAPILRHSKTEVFEMARALDVPSTIVNKTPSAELWGNQTDEKELGFSYWDLDRVMVTIEDSLLPNSEIWLKLADDAEYQERISNESGVSVETIVKICNQVNKSMFKQQIPYYH